MTGKIRSCRQALSVLLAVLLLSLCLFDIPADAASDDELRGVWFSYLDWRTLPSDEEGYTEGVRQVIDRCAELHMNAIFVHVRPDADAMYPSNYFPWSRFITGTQGEDPGYDPLKIFIQEAHARGLQFHAWINPYRVTGYQNRYSQLADSNPAMRWLNDNDSSNDRWVLKHSGEYYFNPSVPEVRDLIINGVREIVRNYDVDGIHFDDYFYPILDDSSEDKWFDKPEYEASGSSLSIAEWRRENINTLVRGVYSAVKSIKPDVQFGISPEGYVDHLRMDDRLFTDIDTWCTTPGYIDYIMPQIYWGFEARLSDGTLAPYAFENNLDTWIDLTKSGTVRLYLGLAMYKAGSGEKDNNSVPEWLRRNDIISREVEAGRKSGKVSGYVFYDYSSFQESETRQEVANLMKVFEN